MSARRRTRPEPEGQLVDFERPEVETPPAVAADPPVGLRAPDFMWGGQPVYRCRVCGRYERVGNLEAVERHEVEAHTKAPEARESRIVGTDGLPLLVAAQEGEGNV